MKKLILLYGLPGSGKSTLAQNLKKQYEDQGLIVKWTETDDWFVSYGGGVYKFEPSKLNEAHRYTFAEVANWMGFWVPKKQPVDVIILSNTNLTWKDIKAYCECAVHLGYDVEIIETDTSWRYDLDELEKKNIHHVPRQALERMNNKRQPVEYLREKIKQVQLREYQW